MDIFSALNVGVGGILAQSGAISDISQNISNSQTVGYKEGLTTFSDLLSDGSDNNYSINGDGAPDTNISLSGVKGGVEQLVSVQGPIGSTNSPTDIAISGQGFFAVSPTTTASADNLEFTRAGSFTPDANGNYVNAAGAFLQAWALDDKGDLPAGLTGASIASGTGIGDLVPVNIQKIISVPVPTTIVTLQANLSASQTAYPGASGTVTMDAGDAANYGISANTVIVPTAIDNVAEGDQFTVTTSGTAPTTNAYTYGGVAYSRSAIDNTVDGSSALGLQQPVNLVAGSGATAAFTFNPASPTTMTINLGTNTPASVGVTQTGQVIKLSGTAAAGLNVNNVTSLDGNYYVTAIDNTNNTITVTIPSNITPPSAMSLNGATFTATTGSPTINVSGATISAGLTDGDTVTFSNMPNIDLSMTSAVLNGTYVVSNVNAVAGTFDITTTTTDTSTGGTGAGSGTTTMFDTTGDLTSGTAAVTTRLFSGDIMDASNTTAPLISTISNFTPAALSFTITTPTTGTSTFTYTPSSPIATQGQFNTLQTLADAINNVSGLTAKIVNNQLYIASTNGNDSITFANGSLNGSNTSPPLAGIDWVSELGLSNVAAAAAGTNRFSTLQGLANEVSASTGLTATVNNPLTAATVKISAANATDTISFADAATNTGSLLGELGLAPSLNGGAFTAQTAGPFGPSYDAANPASNMASGAVPPDFTIPITVVDSAGNNHTLDAEFLKTDTNSWTVEVNAQPPSDVSTTNGQIAAGTVTFNGDGTLDSISPSLTQIAIPWTAAGAGSSSIAFNWGTAGIIGTGLSNGLSQFSSISNVTSIQQNGIQANTSTTTSISSSGVISVTYAGGGTRALYQIPLAEFVDPDQLQAMSGNLYTATEAAGTLNFVTPGPTSGVSIDPSSLESSNVDLATQLTNMIIAQNAYQANTKLIDASNTMLQTLDQMDQSITI